MMLRRIGLNSYKINCKNVILPSVTSFSKSMSTSSYNYSNDVYVPPNMELISKKWNTKAMTPALREEIIEYLTWKMEDDWKLMTHDEIRSAYYISYGEWGPRGKGDTALNDPIYYLSKKTFSVLLFAALAVSVINLRKDKSINKKLDQLAT